MKKENYTQLRLEQRYQIQALVNTGTKQKEIARVIGVHPSTVSRELRRNVAARGRTANVYKADKAHAKTIDRHHEKKKQMLFTTNVKQYIANAMQIDRWSPEIISAIGKRTGACSLSHESIYQWIWKCKHSNKRENKAYKRLYQYLRHGKRRRKRGNRKHTRGTISNRVGIEQRPAIVQQRTRLGDIEIDLMIGKNHKGALLVMTDRTTLYTQVEKLKGKNSQAVTDAIIHRLQEITHPIQTLTVDNDKAFANHQHIAATMETDVFFTRPYTSQDKGTVENRIGVMRRFFPKKTDLTFVSIDEIKRVETALNNRPVRKFNYLTPKQVLKQKIALIS